MKTESSVLLHGCFLATVSSSKHQKFDPSMTMPCINCGTMHSLYPQTYQPPASNLSFNVEIRKVAIRAFSSAGCCSENHLTKGKIRLNTSKYLEIPRISSTGVRSEDSGKIQAHALSWTVPERWEPGALRLAVTRQIMSNAMFFSSFSHVHLCHLLRLQILMGSVKYVTCWSCHAVI